jgi:hypothetical protein
MRVSMGMARVALATTNKITIGTGVTAPILRFDTATVVQLLPACTIPEICILLPKIGFD